MKPFTEHPHQQGISYIQHWYFAMGISYQLVGIAVRFALHAIIPAIAIERRFDLEATIAYLHERNEWIEKAGTKADIQANSTRYHLAGRHNQRQVS